MSIDNLKVSERGSNYFVLSDNECSRLYSYDSLIAIKFFDGKTFLDNKTWDYSLTTGKHRNAFLGEDKKITSYKIKEGIYQLKDLN